MDFKKLDNLNGHYIRATPTTTCWRRKSPRFLARETPPRILSDKARDAPAGRHAVA